jgi:molecular chaperone DnaK (HSP70)
MLAIWTDMAQTATRNAAVAAGLRSCPSDTIQMITEPEAAAIAAVKNNLQALRTPPKHKAPRQFLRSEAR